MHRILAYLDERLLPGTPVSIGIKAGAILILIAYAVFAQTNVGITLVFVMIGLLGTWREYVVWRRRRDQGGLELIGTSRELDEQAG